MMLTVIRLVVNIHQDGPGGAGPQGGFPMPDLIRLPRRRWLALRDFGCAG